MNPLQQFQLNETLREAVKAFMVETLRELAVERVMAQKDVKGVYEAQEVIDNAFNKLEELYAEKKKTVVESSR